MPGCPIRKSRDQIVFANPPRLSQLITSFIASKSQGILHPPLITFFFAPQCEVTPQGRAVCSFCSAYQELVFLDGLTIHHFTIDFSLILRPENSICCHTSVSLQKWLSCLYQYVNERGLFYYSKTNFQKFLFVGSD
jgi:hypothetical protein